MAKVTGSVGFGEASDYESLAVHLDADDVRPEYIPAVTREVPVRADTEDGSEGEQLQDPETGAPLTKTEVVTPARYESLDEAFARALGQYLHVEDVEKSGLTSLRFTVRYEGEVELEYSDYELEDWGEDKDPDDVDASDIHDTFSDDIIEAIREDIGGWGSGSIEVIDFEAE